MTKKLDEKLVTFTPSETFDGYPDEKTKTRFTAGVESVPVPETYAQLMRDKGLVAPRTQLREPKEDAINEQA
ncbi:hypothetical protein ASG25_21805 [Rhizobium sp. Leaf384]|uniref:hypothetical protein n=1 Tax=Rhizobium sp. Leaf384 TaxID=1736358 RepID=UPI000713DD34|nr:hypothetical protein [Rhizobium sp. Leaf384]KQS79827.1 hypothetical protein ASG25_21805 [Rhizobium sp. Leaf384]